VLLTPLTSTSCEISETGPELARVGDASRMGEVAGWPVAFRGTAAVAAGLVTPDMLRGPRFLRLFPDTYVAAPDDGPPDLTLRSHAAYRYVEGRGVLSGYSAAEILGASCGPWDAPAEVTVPHRGQRSYEGLLVHRTTLYPGEIKEVNGLRVTSPVRTAYDLARRGDLVERVVAVDRLANVHQFSPDLLLHFTARNDRARGNDLIPWVLTYADRRAGSPMESRLRMLIRQAGLPKPEVQWVVQDEQTRTAVWLDLAWPDEMIGIEYEGEGHTDPDQVLRDIGRYTALVDKGWRIYRYTKLEILRRPGLIVAQLTRALERTR
jgi:very-short-patch-repair endonuclease